MYDLIIVGGGPSGASSGRIAGKKGLKTLLIEKEIFPRYKACGGALSEHAISYLDFEIPMYIRERDIFGARIQFKGSIIEKHKEYRIAIIVTRSLLDDYLIGKAKETGIDVHMGERVNDYIENKDYVEVYTTNNTYKAKYVIIAEGSVGKLKNKIRCTDKKDEYGICIVTEIEEENEKIDKYIHNAIDIHFGITNRGYGWIFPHEKYYSVGIGEFAKYLTNNPKKIMIDFLGKNGFNSKHKLKGHLIPAGGITRSITSSRVILIGDSAGFIDSFIGEGLPYAIRSGQIAAEVISNLILDKIGNIKYYESICNIEFGNNLKYSLLFAKIMHNFPYMLRILATNEEVVDKFLEIPSAKITYKSFIEWLIPRVPKYVFLGNFLHNWKNIRRLFYMKK